MGETGAGVAIFLLVIVASKLIIASAVTTLGLLHLIGPNRLPKHWAALILGVAVGCAVSFVSGAASGEELLTSVFSLIFTVPPALVVAALWSLARPESDGYRSNKAFFAYVGLWVFLGLCAILVPFSFVG